MKEILIITNYFPFGKDETFLETELFYLNKYGAKITIFSQNTDEIKRKMPNKIVSLTRSSIQKKIYFSFLRFFLTFSLEFFKNLKSLYKIKVLVMQFFKSYDLYRELKIVVKYNLKNENIIIYTYWNDVSTLSSIFLKKEFPQIKVVSRVHGGDLYDERHPKNYLPFRSTIYSNIDKIFCISNHGRDYLKKKYPKFQSKFTLSHLGTTLYKVPNFKINKKLNIISCSHINPIKRLDLLIDSLTLLTIECKWDHLGYGFEYNEKPIFEKSFNLLNPHKYVSYSFIGQLPNKEIIDFYMKNQYSLFINVSSTEGLPVSIMEAMSCGIPVIGTNVGGVSEIISDGLNGFLLSANPLPREVASAIEKFNALTNEEKTIMKQAAYNTWKTKFNAEKNYTEFAETISNL